MKRDVSVPSLLEDLSATARQRDLSVEERRQLTVGLAASLEARLAHRAGTEFDAEDAVLSGDEALIERIARRALTRPRSRLASLRNAALVAAASLLVAAASFGAPWAARRLKLQAPIASAPAALSVALRAPRPAASSSLHVAATPAPPPTAAESALPLEPPAQSRRASAPAAGVRSSSDSVETAAKLYAEANRARRAGQTSLAIARYTDLQQKFGGSAEAKSADMALGMLALGLGRANVALVHFRRVVERGASGGLLPEALWGQGQALSLLGQPGAARESYARILDEYPDSAYASAARARLARSQ